MRVMNRRMFELADKEAKTIDDWATVHFAVGSSMTRICSLMRLQLLSTGKGDLFDELLVDRINEVGHRLGYF